MRQLDMDDVELPAQDGEELSKQEQTRDVEPLTAFGDAELNLDKGNRFAVNEDLLRQIPADIEEAQKRVDTSAVKAQAGAFVKKLFQSQLFTTDDSEEGTPKGCAHSETSESSDKKDSTFSTENSGDKSETYSSPKEQQKKKTAQERTKEQGAKEESVTEDEVINDSFEEPFVDETVRPKTLIEHTLEKAKGLGGVLASTKLGAMAICKATRAKEIIDRMEELGTMGTLKVVGKKSLEFCKEEVPLMPGRFASGKLSEIQSKKILKKFERGRLVTTEDFEFLLYDNALMVFRYKGVDRDVVVPDTVGFVPVRFMHPGALGGKVVGYGLRTARSYFSDDYVEELSMDAIRDACSGLTSVQLSCNLAALPGNVFAGMKSLKRVVIPKNCTLVSPAAFKHSKIESIYFEGEPPKNLKYTVFPKGCKLHCKKEFLREFEAEEV